jgi:uncharacterized protein YndB with AHSA1/START domain/mannose-6-phosphate isomerase-like protein (cupin superfamily)
MTNDNRDLGTLVKLEGRDAVRYERVYPHAPERVWSALIEPDSLKAWFPTSIEGLSEAVSKRRKGEKLRFIFEGDDGPALEGELRACDPPRLLEFTWGTDLLRFELAEAAGGKHCKLVFTTSFEERSHAARDASGWHACLDNLERALDGKQSVKDRPDLGELSERYREQLGSDFPRFLKGAKSADLRRELPAEGELEGKLFKSDDGLSLALVRATEDTDVAHRDLPKGGHLVVIEGTFQLHIGGHKMNLQAGAEFQVPEGAHVRGHMTKGTRVLLATPAT